MVELMLFGIWLSSFLGHDYIADQITVKSQLDYLTELPNDAARRKALKDLPRGLNPTYERLLRRINQTNRETQKLVQRTLKWIAHDQSGLDCWDRELMTAQALCEATSVNIGDNCRDVEAIPDQSEILRSCSSLVRMSVDGQRFEFAHFTVEEFLKTIDDSSNGEFAAYKIQSDKVLTGLAKVCITYLNFQDFRESGLGSEAITQDRFEQYPFRAYVTGCWVYHADVANWEDEQLFELATQLYHPSKRGTFITWMQDRIWCEHHRYQRNSESFLAEATTLHIAVMDGLVEICQWLIKNGCDVNRNTTLGTPLLCALASAVALKDFDDYPLKTLRHVLCSDGDGRYGNGGRERVIHVLLEAGADPNIALENLVRTFSALYLALHGEQRESGRAILQKGAMVDDLLINELLDELDERQKIIEIDEVQYVIEHAQKLDLSDETLARAQCYGVRARASNFPAILATDCLSTSDIQISNRDNEHSLRVAARYGQVDVILRLLDNHRVDVDVVEDSTLFTALHHASMRDQLEVVQLLMARGADPRKADSKGRNALHHSVRMGTRCLSFYLQQNCDTTATDHRHLTVWHVAALNKNLEALRTLLNRSESKIPPSLLQKSRGLSLIACALKSIEVVSLLLDAGCSVFDLDFEGWTPLLHVASTGPPEIAQLLIARGADARAMTDDGSSMFHCAVMGDCFWFDDILTILLDNEVNPFKARQDGITPMELLVIKGHDTRHNFFQENQLRMLFSVPNLSDEKQSSLNQALRFCCQTTPSRNSNWLLVAFKVLLEFGADLMSRDSYGESAFRALVDRWQDQCLMDDMSDQESETSPLAVANEMVLSALKYMPPEGPPQDLCTASSLLRSALAVSNDDLIYKILDYSPDVDESFDDSHDSPIRYACRNGCSGPVLDKLLARSKASSDPGLGSDLIRETCRNESINSNATLLRLLDLGLDCNGHSPRGETALMYAARAGSIDIVNTLIAHSGDATARDHTGKTVGHYACESGRLEVLRGLRDCIDWNAQACYSLGAVRGQGVTVLHLAALRNDDSVLRFLLDEDLITDRDAATEDNVTALFLTAWYNIPRNVFLLLSKDADPTFMSTWGSPLHVAARQGHVEVMSEFMSHGCNLNLPDLEGLDCEMLAWKYGHTRLATTIRGHFEGRTASTSFLSLPI